jgi:hypothetical protein
MLHINETEHERTLAASYLTIVAARRSTLAKLVGATAHVGRGRATCVPSLEPHGLTSWKEENVQLGAAEGQHG